MEKFPHVLGGSPNDLNISLHVKAKRNEGTDYISIVFERPFGFSFNAGNWMDIRFLSPELAIGKTFSIASSPTEPDLMITVKKGVSKFKKALESLSVGDIMLITQYGSNGFLLNKKYQSLFVAGGIGITPFRSMIKEAIDTNNKVSIRLIYLNHKDEFPFKEEFEEWKYNYPYLQIRYVITGKEGRMTKEKLKQLVPDIQDYMSYVAGSPGMVTSIEDMIEKLQVPSEDIKIDSFDGY